MTKQFGEGSSTESELDAAFEAVLLDFDDDGVTGYGLMTLESAIDLDGFDFGADPAICLIAHDTWAGPLPTSLSGVRCG